MTGFVLVRRPFQLRVVRGMGVDWGCRGSVKKSTKKEMPTKVTDDGDLD